MSSDRDIVGKLLRELQKPDALAQYIQRQSGTRPQKRIFVMGCGRSGTWLLTGIMSTFRGVTVLPRELPVEFFGIVPCNTETIVLKRGMRSFERVELIPDTISLLYIVRHPYDVLTSHNPKNGRVYHVDPGRWVGEMMALRWLLESGRKNTIVLKYEELVSDPNRVQAHIGEFLGLKADQQATEYHTAFVAPAEAEVAMHGLRPPDTNSVNRWRSNPHAIEYLRSIRLRLSDCLPWVATIFKYEVALD